MERFRKKLIRIARLPSLSEFRFFEYAPHLETVDLCRPGALLDHLLQAETPLLLPRLFRQFLCSVMMNSL